MVNTEYFISMSIYLNLTPDEWYQAFEFVEGEGYDPYNSIDAVNKEVMALGWLNKEEQGGL